jgi:hypothetical protein
MSETKEIILNSLGAIAREHPELRMGQIIYNYILEYCKDKDCFYISDEEMLDHLENILEKFLKNY